MHIDCLRKVHLAQSACLGQCASCNLSLRDVGMVNLFEEDVQFVLQGGFNKVYQKDEEYVKWEGSFSGKIAEVLFVAGDKYLRDQFIFNKRNSCGT
jgi:hypothetical protein